MALPDEIQTTPAAGDARADGPERYRCLDYTAYYAGDDFKLFESQVTGARHVLPAISEQLLRAGDRFRTLDEHAAIVCQAEPFREVPVEAIRDLLDGLAASGLLISYQELAERCVGVVGEHHPATISTIGVPTCNRPTGLRRVVASAIENACHHGRRIEVVVADDSDGEREAENLAALGELAAQSGVTIWHAGPGEKAAFAERLAQEVGVPLSTAKVALERAPGWPGAPGANRNALLLHAVGEAMLTLDDDMVLTVGRLPEGDDGLTLTSSADPTRYWFYASPETAISSIERTDEDFLGLHESLLGVNVGRLALDQPGGLALDLDTVSAQFLANLQPDGGTVTFTMAGSFGDSGLKESLPFFFLEDSSLDRLLNADGGHRGAMASRQIARGVLRRTVSDHQLCVGMNIGLDNRGLLPPFQTIARNEDGTFAAMVRVCVPGSFIGFLPRAIFHDPVIRRAFDVERFDESVGALEAADVLYHLIGSWPEPVARSTARRRMVSLGSYLVELGMLPAPEFEHRLRQVWLMICSSEAAYIEKGLRQHGSRLPESWSADLRRYLDTLIHRLETDGPVALGELSGCTPEASRATLQRYLGDFGQLLCAWPDLVDGARRLRDRGCRLGRRVGRV